MSLAFSGIKIIDFSQVLAGPYATQLFAMLGADIIKVEPPGTGDQFRNMFPDKVNGKFGMTAAFMSANIGKRSLAIDLKNPKSKEIIFRLIESADAVVENFKGGVIERLGFGYDAVKKVNPDIVYCSVSGYGKTGPMATAPAYDGAIQAASGMMSITGMPEAGPVRTGYMSVDVPTAITTAFALASALYRKLATGEGQHLDVAMMDAAMTLMGANYAALMNGGEDQKLAGNASPTGLPTGNVYPTKNGHVQVTALTEPHAQLLLETIGLQSVLDDPETADNAGRLKNNERLLDQICEIFRREDTETWLAKLRDIRIPCAPIRGMREVLADPQLQHRQIVRKMPTPDDGKSEMEVIGAAFTANTDSPVVPSSAPTLGEHNAEILRDIGYSLDEIGELKNQAVIAN